MKILNALAKTVIKVLKDEGFVVQRYDSITTNSIYLKLDYGVSHSIRISDHYGKKHLSYRFNLLTNIEKSYSNQGKCDRHFYTKDDLQDMLRAILYNRENQKLKYGFEQYERLMAKNKRDGSSKTGFWSKARIV